MVSMQYVGPSAEDQQDQQTNYYVMLVVNLAVIAINVYLYRLSTRCDVKSRTTFQIWFGVAVLIMGLQTLFAVYQHFKK